MEKILHIIDSREAAWTLGCVLSQIGREDKILYYPLTLTYGEIPYGDAFRDIIDKDYRYMSKPEKELTKEKIAEFYSTDYSQYDKVIAWHSNNSDSQFLLYLTAILLEDNDNFYEVDLSKLVSISEPGSNAPNCIEKRQTSCYYGEELLKGLYFISKVDEDRREELEAWWLVLLWRSGFSKWRFIHNGDIVVLEDDWMDNAILEQLALTTEKHKLREDYIKATLSLKFFVSTEYPVIARIREKEKDWGYHVTYNRYVEKKK